MTDLTPGERTGLMTRLHDAVPEAPELVDLAPRAETRARRVRRTRRVGVLVAAAAAVAAVIVVPQLAGGHENPPTTPQPAPAHCVRDTRLDHQDFRVGTAAWVIPCTGPERLDMDIPMPSGVLRGRAAASLVRTLQAKAYDAYPQGCPSANYPGIGFQVGFTDGTVAAVGLSGCGGTVSPGNQAVNEYFLDFADLLASDLQRQNDDRHRRYRPTRPPPQCPPDLSNPAAMNIDGRSARTLDTTGALLDLSADEALVCRYDGGRLVETRRDLDPERLLLTSASGWYLDNPGDYANAWGGRDHPVPPSEYLVTLRDKTDTWRTFTVTGRVGIVTFYRGGGHVDRLGFASPPLLEALGLHAGR